MQLSEGAMMEYAAQVTDGIWHGAPWSSPAVITIAMMVTTMQPMASWVLTDRLSG